MCRYCSIAGLPVALDWSDLHVWPAKAGTATGFLLLAGNLGGTVLVLLVQAVVGNPYLALGVLTVVAMPGLILAAQLPRTGAVGALPTPGAIRRQHM